MTKNAAPGEFLGSHRSFIKAIIIGAAICGILIEWSSYNKRIGEPIFHLKTRLEYVAILSPPLLMCATTGSLFDYRKSKRAGLLLLTLAGLIVSLATFLFLAWVASLAAGSR
jgi:hypothetical protein